MKIKVVIGWFISAIGLIAILLSLSAEMIGVDQDGGWGPARRFALLFGITAFILPHIFTFVRSKSKNTYLSRWSNGLVTMDDLTTMSPEMTKECSDLAATELSQRLLQRRWIIITSLVTFIFSFILLTWLIGAGRWEPWPDSTNYYHLLADGFRAGQTHLLVNPPADLLTLPNPYDPSAREDLPYLWDVSLYEGKYYLYWGPAPALVVSLLEGVLPMQIGDNHLVWLFCLLSIAVLLMTSGVLWDRLFSQLPGWTFLPVALAISFAHPFPWMMGRPAIYEAAIVAGQFFLLASLFLILPVFWDSDLPDWRLFLAGLFGGLAFASRVTLMPAIALLLAFAIWRIALASSNKNDVRRKGIAKAVILLFPCVLILIGMTLYNYDRFGSIFELGHRYQLGRWDKLSRYNLIASIANIPLNLQNYFLQGVHTLSIFPYIKPRWGQYSIPYLRLDSLDNYHTEKVVGVLLGSPFIVFSIFPILGLLFHWWHNLDAVPAKRIFPVLPITNSSARMVFNFLIALFVLALGPLLILSVNSMRHEMDFLPTLLLLSVLGYGQSLVNLRSRNRKAWIMNVGALLLAASTVSIGFMLGITGYQGRFETLNPELFQRLTRFFTF